MQGTHSDRKHIGTRECRVVGRDYKGGPKKLGGMIDIT